MFDLALSDLRRKREHFVLRGGFVEKYVMTTLQLGTLAVFVYRCGAFALRQPPVLRAPLLALYAVLNALSCALTGVRINPRTPIGPGLIIHNFATVNLDAEYIGGNFTANQGVSLGPDWRGSGRPKIGDNVYFGSGAKALGDVTLGNNVVVGANALVLSSVPDNCTVAGVPARIVARDSGSQYLQLNAPGRAAAEAGR